MATNLGLECALETVLLRYIASQKATMSVFRQTAKFAIIVVYTHNKKLAVKSLCIITKQKLSH